MNGPREYRNVTWDELQVGARASLTRRISTAEVEALALVSGDVDPFQLDADGVRPDGPMRARAVGAEAIISGLLSRKLPGPGTVVLAQDLRFSGELTAGDEVDATVCVIERLDDARATFDCTVRANGRTLIEGRVIVRVPTERIRYAAVATPDVLLRRTDVFARLLARCESLSPVRCGVVHPVDRDALLGPLEAARRGLIVPVLVGPAARIAAAAADAGVALESIEIVDTEHSHAAARTAVELARRGELDALMKGSLHTDELMGAIVPSATGLRTARRVSHVFVLDVPAYPRPLLVTDAAINIQPSLADKADIAQNAIDLAHVLGIAQPKVAILSAVETVNAAIPSTLDAAALCKMADRGQITGGLLDGPLAFDNAISADAARTKKIASPVAGQADILLVPDLESGNMLAKQLQYLAGADSAGIVLGTRVPIVLTSRADSVATRLASAAVMVLVAHARRASAAGVAG
ncbi:MAG: bifunctional enoyl-CoA hydratase/phosphate acetyltransferase [Burkholderiaceae bacterium]|jgi:phosphate acetyltransferase|nr:bifunctional enoyl-CoA hydratase/phosphate acetyltransferase [Burkholderiaceae bacterium]